VSDAGSATCSPTGLAYDWTDDDQDGEFTSRRASRSPRCSTRIARNRRGNAVVDAARRSMRSRRRAIDRCGSPSTLSRRRRGTGHIDALRERADGSVGEEPE
jgi:hypothetical protein